MTLHQPRTDSLAVPMKLLAGGLIALCLAACQPQSGPASDALANGAAPGWTEAEIQTDFGPRNSARTFDFEGYHWLSNGYFPAYDFRDLWRSKDGVSWEVVNADTPYDPYSGMAVLDGYIYAVNHSAWRSKDGKTWEKLVDAAPMRRDWGSESRLITFKNRLWFFGFGVVWSSADGRTWTKEPAPAYGSRGAYQVVVWRDRFWVVGGYRDAATTPPESAYPERTSLNDVWSSADGKTWQRMDTSNAWSPRYWHSVLVHGDALYLLAGLSGRDNQNLNDVWKTTDGKTWKKVEAGPLSFTPRHYPTVFSHGRDIVITAGLANEVENDVWRLRPPG